MSDTISREAAIEAKQEFRNPNVVRNTEARTAYDRTYANGWNDCNLAWINAIKALPSAQPKIIYCGECKHMMPNGKCRQFADSTIRPSASDFCSAGERKDNG